MSNRVCSLLNIEKPIIQGPMAWISTAPLVAAVSNAGGLGVLGVGFAPLEFVQSQIIETRKLTDKPFAINTILIPELLDATTRIIEENAVPVVYADSLANLNEDMCRKYFELWHKAGSKIVVKTGTVSDSIVADNAGADVIIVKGWEGGGHTSVEATTVLVPQVADVLRAPIVASGGIADGRGMVAAIALGAEGIEMGTAFMVASEAAIPSIVKDEMLKAGDMSTVIVGNTTGEPCRQITNKLSNTLAGIEASYTREEAAAKVKEVAGNSLKLAMVNGDIENGAIMAGQIVPLITEIRPAAKIIEDVLDEAKKVLEDIQKYNFI